MVLLDDTHLSYGHKIFWTKIVKAQIGAEKGLQICLFASHGHPVTGDDTTEAGHHDQLARFEACQRISTIRSRHVGPDHPQLYYSREEFTRVVAGMRTFFKFVPEIDVDAEK